MTGRLPGNVPVMVNAAQVAAQRLGFENSCTDAVGQLLEVLAGQFTGATIGEIGGGCGVGAAWLLSGLPADARLVTIDNDEARVKSARSQFADHRGVDILLGDWRDILSHGPFAMLFVDVADAKEFGIEEIVDTLRPGGLVVIDDLTPVELWPEDWRGKPDPVREVWLNHPRLRGVELLITPESAVILATRRR